MTSRWVVRLALAALAPIVVLAGLDRASYQRPELSMIVPQPFRSFAQAPVTVLALTAGDPASALVEARRLVRRRPMAGEHLFQLALAQLKVGRPRAFADTFRAASTRGWRYPALQVTAAQAALDSRDAAGAAQRVAAVWAADGGNAALPALTRALLELPGGPEAFGEAMAGSRIWRNNFLGQSGQVTSAPLALRTALAAQRAGARFECTALERFRLELGRRGQPVDPGALPCR